MASQRSALTLSPSTLRLLDIGGFWVSSACAVHCAVTPLVLVALPFVGWQSLELWLRGAAIGVGLIAIGGGALFHRTARAVPSLLVGIALIVVASLLHGSLIAESGVSVLASLALLRAHWLNTRACAKVCHDCPPARAVVAAVEGTAVQAGPIEGGEPSSH